jgi:ketosteroid isomerase-like protein
VIRLRAIALLSCVMIVGCRHEQRHSPMLTHDETEVAIAELRAAYAAFTRGDIDAAVQCLDPNVEWTESPEFLGGGTYHGVEGAKQYLAQSRAGAADVISEPEKFITSGDRIVVFANARVSPKHSNAWQEIKLADVYTFQKGRATEMRGFANRTEAVRWAGIQDPDRHK